MLRARAVPLAACILACSLALRVAAEAPRIETLAELPKVLAESSGVAVSRAHPGVLWTHNDSGGTARLFALTHEAAVLATFRVPGISAVDWEDVALGTCPGRSASCLFIADTGDNLENRRSVAIQIVTEPPLPKQPPDRLLFTEKPHTLRVRYADGPHDVEAIAFDPDGNLLLISKGQKSAIHVYRVVRGKLSAKEATAELIDLDTIAPRAWLGGWITGAATSPAKTRLVVRTYTELSFYRFGAKRELIPDGPPCALGFVEPQGEGVDFLDEDTLVLTSESRGGSPGSILRVTCPRETP